MLSRFVNEILLRSLLTGRLQQHDLLTKITVCWGLGSKAVLRYIFYFKTLLLKVYSRSIENRHLPNAVKENHSGKATQRENAKREIMKDGFLSTRKHVGWATVHNSASHVTIAHGQKHLQEDQRDRMETITHQY